MSKDDIKNKIEEELTNSGFLLELFCVEKFLKNGFGVSSIQYFKDNTGVNREVDAEAKLYSYWTKGKIESNLFTSVIIECKKNKKNPWVFIQDSCFTNLNCFSDSKTIQDRLNSCLFEHNLKHHYQSKIPKAKNYIVCFCDSKSIVHRQIFDAITNVIDYYIFDQSKIRILRRKNKVAGVTNISYLTIVFDGSLFLAKATQQKIDIKEANHIIISVSHQNTIDTKIEYYTIDVVQKYYFETYLKTLIKDHKIIESFLRRS